MATRFEQPEIGRRVHAARTDAELSLTRLAGLAGVSRNFISTLERGVALTPASRASVQRVLRALEAHTQAAAMATTEAPAQ